MYGVYTEYLIPNQMHRMRFQNRIKIVKQTDTKILVTSMCNAWVNVTVRIKYSVFIVSRRMQPNEKKSHELMFSLFFCSKLNVILLGFSIHVKTNTKGQMMQLKYVAFEREMIIQQKNIESKH